MTQKEFIKYPSLTNLRQDWLDKHILPVYGDEPAYVTEKVHGTNLTVEYDGENFLFGRRKAWLEEGEAFYELEAIKAPLCQRLMRMYKEMKIVLRDHYDTAVKAIEAGEEAAKPDIDPDFKTITLRGEFFGGGFEHPEVPKVKGMGQIQGGIQYSQEKSYTVFRIEIDGEPVDMSTMGMLCMSFNIPHVPVVFMGTLKECIEWSRKHNADNSVIPLGFPMLDADGKAEPHPENPHMYKSLPQFAEGENIREGNVITTKKPITLPNGSALIIKDKNEKWSECKPTKADKAPPKELEGNLRTLYDAILPFITVNRFSNVKSHEGGFKQNELMKAVGLVVKDALDDFFDEASSESLLWTDITTAERKQLTKRLNFACTERIKSEFFATVVM